MKSKFLLLLFLLRCGFALNAQNILVTDFHYAENDLTARYHGTSVEDQNGNICALIKVETTEKGLWSFDVGALGVTKTEFQNAAHPAEIWVYVPFSVTWISIQHEQLGKLDRYKFPCSIDKGCTYVMKLTTGRVKTIVEEEVRQQYLLFQLDPPNAILEVDDKLWNVEADGTAMKYVNFGTYNYRVRASDYATEVGKVTVDNPDETKIVPVKLKSNLVEVTLTVDADAEIWVNNQKKGVRTWTGKLGNGTYKIECKQEGHETTMVSKEITTEMNGETITLPAPTPIYGSLMVESTPNLCQLYIDGKDYGTTPKSINNILVGQHEIRLTKDGYNEYKETVTIAKGERKQVKTTMNKQKVQQPMATTTSSSEDQTFIVNGISFTMKFVEGGTFQMGATSEQGSDAESNEKPVHSVTLSSFYIGETEVTQALWKAVMGDNPSYFLGDDLPVEQVRWDDCQKFISKLNQMTGKNFRLPSEAEWEYAARGGKKSRGYKYAGSNTIGNVAWYDGNSGSKTHIVKTKSPNELGLYDMSGNVYEWCNDWYANYNDDSPVNPEKSYVILRRGGSFGDDGGCRVSSRDFFIPVDVYYDYITGFRLCLPQLTANPVNNGGQSPIQQTSSTIPEGAVSGVFSISSTQKVYFSKGNLQYQASTNTWRFAEHQWDCVGGIKNCNGAKYGNVYDNGVKCNNNDISSSYSGWIDLFGWGTSGYHNSNDPYNVNYQPWSTNQDYGSGYGPSKNMVLDNHDNNLDNYDWGVYNKISNGGNQVGVWRTLTNDEWVYLFDKRITSSGIRYVRAIVNGVNGIILLPDDWSISNYPLNNTNKPDTNFDSNTITTSVWNSEFSSTGAVFLPAAGRRYQESYDAYGHVGIYWSASYCSNQNAYCGVAFGDNNPYPKNNWLSHSSYYKDSGYSVRLVCPAE